MKLAKVFVSTVALITTTIGISQPDVSSANTRNGSCPQWNELAYEVGFTRAEWSRMTHVVYGESRCKASAINRKSGDYGLTQIHYKIWGPRFGFTRQDLLDPAGNLAAAHEILENYGWSPWY